MSEKEQLWVVFTDGEELLIEGKMDDLLHKGEGLTQIKTEDTVYTLMNRNIKYLKYQSSTGSAK